MKRNPVIFGALSEGIRLAPLVLRLARRPGIEGEVSASAQHSQTSDWAIASFGMLDDHDLNLTSADQPVTGFAARALTAQTELAEGAGPGHGTGQGDPTAALVSELAGLYL